MLSCHSWLTPGSSRTAHRASPLLLIQTGQRLYVDGALGTNNPVNVGNEEQNLWSPDDGDLYPKVKCLCLLAQANPGSVPHDTVGSLDASFLVEPVAGEQFDTHEACFIRLQGYVLSQGFAIVALTSKAKEAQFGCIRHGEKPRNTHGLEKYVVKDEEGNILTRRKKENTSFNGLGCTWKVYWSVRSVGD